MIIAALVGLTPAFPAEDQIYAYAIGVLAGTVVQLVLPMPWLRGRGGRFTLTLDWRDSNVRRVLVLMLPVTITLGLINFSLLVNLLRDARLGAGPRRDRQGLRIYMLPQGIFSVAIATILFQRCRASPRAGLSMTSGGRLRTAFARSVCSSSRRP